MKDTSVLMNEFKKGTYESLLKDIYVDDSVLEYQRERYIKALNQYEEIFGEEEVEIYSAPGRSEVGAITRTINMVRFLQRLLTWMPLQ